MDYTPFVITDKDLEEEFNPSNRTRRQTKEESIYGIWAQQVDDSPRVYRKRTPKPKYIGFVSGGFNNEEKHQKTSKLDKKTTSQVDSRFGSWEKHTKGIGMKLLMKQGFQPGQGLGQNKQGISTPIMVGKTVNDNGTFVHEGPKIEREKVAVPMWKKYKRQSKTAIFLTTEELLATKRAKKYQHCHQNEVVDLTGPEMKVYSDYGYFGNKSEANSTESSKHVFSCKEVIHNLNLVVGMIEADIIENELAIQTEEVEVKDLKFQLGRFEKQAKTDHEVHRDLSRAIRIVDDCLKRQERSSLTQSAVHDTFFSLIDRYPKIYIEFELSRLSTVLLGPLFEDEIGSESMLANLNLAVNFVRYWQRFFDKLRDALSHLPNRDWRYIPTWSPFDRLLCDVWLGKVQDAVRHEWEVDNPRQLVDFCEIWDPILPAWMWDYVMDNYVLPKLVTSLCNWSPSSESAHVWIEPWLDVFGSSGSRAKLLYDGVLKIIGDYLSTWHPSDDSGYFIVLPWLGIIPYSLLDTMLLRKVVPKLSNYLQTSLLIDPSDQKLDVWLTFTQWHDVVHQKTMVELIDRYFFPPFLKVLKDWLIGSPDYSELNKWYLGWKSTFPSKYLTEEIIKNRFKEALSMMDCVYSARRDGVLESRTPSSTKRDSGQYLNVSPSVTKSRPNSLKDLVAVKAAENGIEYFPIRNKFINGKQVYKLGSAQLYVDRDVIYLFSRRTWRPESLSDIISRKLYLK